MYVISVADDTGLLCHSIESFPRSQSTQRAFHVDIHDGQAIDVARVDPSEATCVLADAD